MRRSGTWGSALECEVAAELSDRNVVVFSKESFRGDTDQGDRHFKDMGKVFQEYQANSGEIPDGLQSPMHLAYEGGSHYCAVSRVVIRQKESRRSREVIRTLETRPPLGTSILVDLLEK